MLQACSIFAFSCSEYISLKIIAIFGNLEKPKSLKEDRTLTWQFQCIATEIVWLYKLRWKQKHNMNKRVYNCPFYNFRKDHDWIAGLTKYIIYNFILTYLALIHPTTLVNRKLLWVTSILQVRYLLGISYVCAYEIPMFLMSKNLIYTEKDSHTVFHIMQYKLTTQNFPFCAHSKTICFIS